MYIMRNKKLKLLNKIGVSVKNMSEILKVSESTIRKRKKKLNLPEYCELCRKPLTKDETRYCKNCKIKRKKEMRKPSNTKYRFKHKSDLKTKTCKFCGSAFETRDSKKLYCSEECYLAAKSNREFSNRLRQKNAIKLENIMAFSSMDEDCNLILEPLTVNDISSHGDLYSTARKNQMGNSNLDEHPKKTFEDEAKMVKKELNRLA